MVEKITRFLFRGPILGAAVGIVHSAISTGIWVKTGTHTEFYYRSIWDALQWCVFASVAGGIVGCLLAGGLITFEQTFSRRIPVGKFTAISLAGSTIYAIPIILKEFRTREFSDGWYFLIVPIFAAILGVALSKPRASCLHSSALQASFRPARYPPQSVHRAEARSSWIR